MCYPQRLLIDHAAQYSCPKACPSGLQHDMVILIKLERCWTYFSTVRTNNTKKDVAKNEGVRIRTEHDEKDVLKCVSKNEEVIITYDNCCCFRRRRLLRHSFTFFSSVAAAKGDDDGSQKNMI